MTSKQLVWDDRDSPLPKISDAASPVIASPMSPDRRHISASDRAREIMRDHNWEDVPLDSGRLAEVLEGVQRDVPPGDPVVLFLTTDFVRGAIARRFRPNVGGPYNISASRPSPRVHELVTFLVEQLNVVANAATREVPSTNLLHRLSVEQRVRAAAYIFGARGSLLREVNDEEEPSREVAWRADAARRLEREACLSGCLSVQARRERVRALFNSLIGDASEKMRESRSKSRRHEVAIDELFDKQEAADQDRRGNYEKLLQLEERVRVLEETLTNEREGMRSELEHLSIRLENLLTVASDPNRFERRDEEE